MGKTQDTFRLLASPYTEVQLREMKTKKEAYPLNLTELRVISPIKRAQVLARIKADIPLVIKMKIPLHITGCTEQEAKILKQALGYP